MRKIILPILAVLVFGSLVFAYEWATTLYVDEREYEAIEDYCINNNLALDDACLLQYFQEQLNDDRNSDVIDNIEQLSDFCYDQTKYELCRLFRDNMMQIYQVTNGGSVWWECQDGEPQEWTTTHCLTLSNSNTRCQQSGFVDTLYLDCSGAWVQI